MQKVRYINSKGESVYFDIQPPLILQTIKGTGEVSSNTESQKSPYQDGATYINSKLEERDIFMQVAFVSGNDQELFRMRQDIQRVFNPKLGQGYLIYETSNGTKMIRCVPDGTPSFGGYDGNSVTCQINMIAFKPVWTDVNDLSTDTTNISTYITKYNVLPTIPTFTSNVTKSGTIVTNNGTFDAPIVIEIDGETVENVIVTNVTTGESLEVNRAIPVGSKLYINTAFGSERVVQLVAQDGTVSNGFPYLTFTSKFFQLEVGDNTLSYTTNSTDIGVYVIWSNCYIGL